MISDIQIDALVKQALDSVMENDKWLMANNLSEQSISHRIAHYLTPLFSEYDVDCEYNGDINRENNKKAINILKDELFQLGLLREEEANDLENELTLEQYSRI